MSDASGVPPSPKTARALYFNAGFLVQKRVRRILELSGYAPSLGWPQKSDFIAVWGQSPTAYRGEIISALTGAAILRVEDAFLRSLFPARVKKDPPLGLLLDTRGVHFDPSRPNDLECLLAEHPLDDENQILQAKNAIERMKNAYLSKYFATDLTFSAPPSGYILVVDQLRDDASVTASNGDKYLFREMLSSALKNHPDQPIVIKTHPEKILGARAGYYGEEHCTEARISLYEHPCSPWEILSGAKAVYTLSSQLGFEAILCGHRPEIFGSPFYAGWGLSKDYAHLQRRQRTLTKEQLFLGAMMLYPKWYDPFSDRLCGLEEVLSIAEAQSRSWREDHNGWRAQNIRLWKRKTFRSFFGQYGRIDFSNAPKDMREVSNIPPVLSWAGKTEHSQQNIIRVEDGFLRSRGLGANLVPPLSLISDDLGIYYDPTRPSRLEMLIMQHKDLRDDQRQRVLNVIDRVIRGAVTKYNLSGNCPNLPEGHRILVPGQVEDDASILKGTDRIRTNIALLKEVRRRHPKSIIIYKPHPDVEAGLRKGDISQKDQNALADVIANQANPAALLSMVQEIHTMTSNLGFEALLRGVEVTTYGAPYYAGWGLTTDLGSVPTRRKGPITLESLAYAALIAYPRYFDPVTEQACPIEVALARLEKGDIPHPGQINRLLAKLQGAIATPNPFWR